MVSELSLGQAWTVLSSNERSVMIDCRTVAEWNFVGLPDLRAVGKEIRTVEWVRYPDGAPNIDFVAQATEGIDPGDTVLLLCRSGARSRAAAQALAAAGYGDVHNVTAGFEGDLDGSGHRHGGWKDSLPWVQS